MINYEKVASKIFSTIKGHGHDLVMFTDEGMETSNAEEARRFFVADPNYMVTLDGEARHIKINKNSNVSLDDMESIMKQIKNLANANMLKTEIRVFGKEITPKDFAYQAKNMKESSMENIQETSDWVVRIYKEGDTAVDKFIIKDRTEQQASKEAMHEVEREYPGLDWTLTASSGELNESSFSRMHGFKKTSYQTLESTKIVVRHRRPVEEEVQGSRARNIQAIFIEHAGERFRFPHNHLAGARAMARHINEGGEMKDPVGKYIIESINNYNKLMEFIRYARTNKLINEESEDITKTVKESMGVIRREIAKLQGATTYGTMKETIESGDVNVIEEEGDDVSDLKDMFTVRKFDEKIGDILPIVKKLMDNKSEWRDALVEASEKEVFISDRTGVSETEMYEFDSPVQKMGYRVKDIAERMIGESDLQTFVGKVAGKLIEGEKVSAFEKKVVGNVLENVVIKEEDELCESCGEIHEDCKCGANDTLGLISESFELKMKMLEHEGMFEEIDQDLDEGNYRSWDGPLLRKLGSKTLARKLVPGLGKREADERAEDNFFTGRMFRDAEYLSKTGEGPEYEMSPEDAAEKKRAYKQGRRYARINKGEKPFASEVDEANEKGTGMDLYPPNEWWKNDPEELMTYIYWKQGQIPPENKAEAWDSIVASLSKKFLAPEGEVPVLEDGWDDEVRRGESESGATGMGMPMDDRSISEQVADLLAQGEKVISTVSGATGRVKQVDDNLIVVQPPHRQAGVANFNKDHIFIEYNDSAGHYMIVSQKDRNWMDKVDESDAEKAASGRVDPEDFMDDCPDCDGTGKAKDSIFDDDECLKCGGEGYI